MTFKGQKIPLESEKRTKAGLTAIRARSRKGGRKPAMNEDRIEQARAMMDNSKLKVKSILKTLEISKATLYKYVPMSKYGERK